MTSCSAGSHDSRVRYLFHQVQCHAPRFIYMQTSQYHSSDDCYERTMSPCFPTSDLTSSSVHVSVSITLFSSFQFCSSLMTAASVMRAAGWRAFYIHEPVLLLGDIGRLSFTYIHRWFSRSVSSAATVLRFVWSGNKKLNEFVFVPFLESGSRTWFPNIVLTVA